MNSRRKIALILVLMTAPALAQAQDHGGGSGGSGGSGHEGGSSGCGDVFGELVHIKRDAATGQPILQKRWVELPGDSFGWAYCPIPINGAGEEIGFADLSCDAADPTAVFEVDYFGRLSGGRTKERNSRMHFDEVISSIKDPAVDVVDTDETGRLRFGYECDGIGAAVTTCASWRTTDSPMENLALYARMMKYGHLQTDPMEVDTNAHGDPALGTQYHPALGAADYAKFDAGIGDLLPRAADGLSPADTCFGGGVFNAACARNESLKSADFIHAASFLAGAADKHGVITVDLVQYMNRILKIALDTPMSTAARDTLPALVRDCGGGDGAAHLPPEQCSIKPAVAGLPAPANERFVDFKKVGYVRQVWRRHDVAALQPIGNGTWIEVADVQLMDWLNDVNGFQRGVTKNIDGFVLATLDGVRAVEFVHNYELPELLWDFVPNRR